MTFNNLTTPGAEFCLEPVPVEADRERTARLSHERGTEKLGEIEFVPSPRMFLWLRFYNGAHVHDHPRWTPSLPLMRPTASSTDSACQCGLVSTER